MGKVKIITSAEAAEMIQDNMTVTTTGFIASCLPETLTKAVEKRFLETGSPKNLTLYYTSAQGFRNGTGADHFAHEGMLKRVIGGHYNFSPNLGELVLANKIEGYNFPQGVLTQIYRDVAAGHIGTLTHVGLNTYVDPRIEGGKLNEITKEDLIQVVEINGEERLFYKPYKFDIALMRGNYADENGNISLEKEVGPLNSISVAEAVHNCGGKVIVQVEKIVTSGSLDPKLVKIPGIFVDAVVIAESKEDQAQCYGCEYDASMTGEYRVPLTEVAPPPLSVKKIIGRRAAMELEKDKIVNLGVGVPEYVAAVANEEGIGDWLTMTVEAGGIGGLTQGGAKFGGAVNPQAIIEENYLFDFYDGGGIDQAFLGLAQVDGSGNINVSKFGPRVTGCGGFINISQNASKVYFCGTFTAGGFKSTVEDGKLVILNEGKSSKFVKEVEQITFSGDYARKSGQKVMYITERAVFELREDGLYLLEIAPGIDLQTQILDLMAFEPKIDGEVRIMDSRIFKDEPMGLKNK